MLYQFENSMRGNSLKIICGHAVKFQPHLHNSFELVAAREYDKDIRLGYLYWGVTDGERIEKLKAIGATQACPKATDLTDNELGLIHKNGFECRAWGIADTEIMKKAVLMGVDAGMTVNFPDKLVEYLNNK